MGNIIKDSPKQMTFEILNLMKYGGTNPLLTTNCQLVTAYLQMLITGIVVILMSINFWKIPHESVGAIVTDLIILIGFIQILVKYYTAVQSKQTLADMIKNSWNSFWDLESVDNNTKTDIINLYRKTSILTFIYSSGAMAAVYSIVIKSVFSRAFVMDIWIPNKEEYFKYPYYETIVVVEIVIITLGVYIGVVQLDKLFIVMIVLVFVQFKLIKLKILAIGQRQSKNENLTLMRNSIIHHNLLLKFVAGFESVYSRLFLPTVISNIIIATICMWGFITEELISNKIMCFTVYFTVMSQVLAYCIAGQIIQDAGTNLGHAAYHCNWTSVQDYKIRMGIIMIMMQSTRKIELTVGGFMVLCMESFGSLCRASFSFLAFLINVRRK